MKANRLYFGILFILLTVGLQAQQGGYALEFNGTKYVNCGNDASVCISGTALTLEAWVYPTAFSTYVYENVIVNKLASTTHGYNLRCGGNGIVEFYVSYNFSNTGFATSGTGAIELNKWTHLAGTYDGANVKLYINGVLTVTTPYTASIPSQNLPLIIGNHGDINFLTRPFIGKIDEVRIWNIARTQQEIRDNMYKEIGTHANLKAYYQMSNGSGITLTDNSGNSNAGTISSATWTSSTAPLPYFTVDDGNWTTSSTWASGQNAPTNDWASVKINNVVSLNSGDGKTVNDLNVASGGALTVKDGATLITNGNVINSGTTTVEKTITDGMWQLVSSPVENAFSNVFAGEYLQQWSEPNDIWSQITTTNTPLTPGKGFSLWGNNKAGETTYSFIGNPNTDEVDYSITYTNNDTSSNDGANLVGNPYTSYLDWNEVNGYGPKYTYNGSGYDVYTESKGYGAGSRYVEPMQGFFIVTEANGLFSFTYDMRTHAPSKKSGDEKALQNGLVLSAFGNDYEDQLWLVMDEEASEAFELQNDAWKLLSSSEGISQLWSVSSSGKLAVDVRPETEIIQLGFANNQNGTYSIGVSQIANISIAELEDTKLNIFHNLSNGAYTFDWNTADSENRFILHLKATGTDDLEAQAAKVYAANKRVYVRLSELNSYSEMAVYDLRGRMIVKKILSSNSLQSFELNQPSGAYLVQLQGANGTESFKIVL